jgi:protein O-mannosyl-transferase
LSFVLIPARKRQLQSASSVGVSAINRTTGGSGSAATTTPDLIDLRRKSKDMQNPLHIDRHAALAVVLLTAMTLAVFAPLVSFQFINVDDSLYITANARVQQGLTWRNAAWALTSLDAANWQPVTWLSHMLDVTLFGLNPGGHHATSLLIHTLNVILLFLWLRSMTGALWKSALVAALFAVHPLGLESVAWIAERKNVLSTMFLLLTLWAYVGYARKPGVPRYLLVALLFTMGLMSKSMLVTLPFALLLLDYWPLGRLGLAPRSTPSGNERPATVIFWRCAEKLPLLLLAAGSAVLTLKAQALDNEIKIVPLSSRVANALLSYGTYLAQAAWPAKLAIFYPYRDWAIFSWQVVLSLVSICLITALVVWQIKKRPYLAVGWFWYLGTLVPVVGLVHVGDIAHADRYTYVPLLGVFIAIVWGAADLGRHFPALRYGLIAGAGFAVVALAIATTRDISYWHSGISISERSLAVTGPNCLMERALGEAFYSQGRMDDALEHLTRSSQIQPTDTAFFSIGTIKFQQKKFEEAAFFYQKALQYPGEARTLAGIHNNLAVLETQQGSLADAEKDFKESIALDPFSARHRVAYGWLLAKEARYDEAISQYEEALKTVPDALAYFSLGSALEEQHKLPQAAEAYRKTLALAPSFEVAQLRLNAITAGGQ